jgi:septal ring factor EnvC (AmiA/AmiB activator)
MFSLMPSTRRGRIGRGRSVGVAEHPTRTGLTHMNRATHVAVVIGALALMFSFLATPAIAQSTGDRVSATRAAIDDAADRWFAAQRDASEIDEEIAQLEQRITDLQAKVARTRETATERALLIYKGASTSMAIDGVVGDDAMDSARRAELIDHANEESHRAIDALDAATEDLKAKHSELEARRDEERAVLAKVADERTALDDQLATLEVRASKEEAARLASTRRARAPKASGAPIRPISSPASSVAAAPLAASPTPAPSGGGGVSSHHNDPFLVCTRTRESNGNYGAVSPAGYYGAYQFAPTTWNATASHAGRLNLVGVLPSHASVYDQDEMAWSLYQWQGKAPWGGRC